MNNLHILDTDHMSILERGGASALPLTMKLSTLTAAEIATTIVSYEEQCKGWLAKTSRGKDEALVEAYLQLGQHLIIYSNVLVLPYDERAHAIFQTLQSQRVRIGTQDLKIASIALANDAVVLTRNIRHFAQVPNLKYEDWTV